MSTEKDTKIYGVLKARVAKDEGTSTSRHSHATHYNLITTDSEITYRVNIDIQSDRDTPNVHMLCMDRYEHPITKKFDALPDAFSSLSSEPGTVALDYLRQDLFPKERLYNSDALSAQAIAAVLDSYVSQHEHIIVFGTGYGTRSEHSKHYRPNENPNTDEKQPIGVDDVHQNQGNTGKHAKNNKIYQDGALFVRMPDQTYSAFFFWFTEQCYKTDDTGNCIESK